MSRRWRWLPQRELPIPEPPDPVYSRTPEEQLRFARTSWLAYTRR